MLKRRLSKSLLVNTIKNLILKYVCMENCNDSFLSLLVIYAKCAVWYGLKLNSFIISLHDYSFYALSLNHYLDNKSLNNVYKEFIFAIWFHDEFIRPRKWKIKFREKDKCFYVSIYLGNETGTIVLFEIIFPSLQGYKMGGGERRR